jgi:hypothetical protein
MAFDVLLNREGNRLVAIDAIDADAILSIKQGETVCATIRRPRNVKHHRKLWALLNVIFENQSRFATKHDLLSAMKIATGLYDEGRTIDGIPFIEPKSISFTSMDQADFEEWYARAVEVIVTKILPGASREDIEQEVMSILEGEKHVC